MLNMENSDYLWDLRKNGFVQRKAQQPGCLPEGRASEKDYCLHKMGEIGFVLFQEQMLSANLEGKPLTEPAVVLPAFRPPNSQLSETWDQTRAEGCVAFAGSATISSSSRFSTQNR